ncbi:MAG: NUDIX hydrolase [Pseudomonadota bacterium]|nr:NUDIX hydrolase [Pseudomonadota bacterium]
MNERESIQAFLEGQAIAPLQNAARKGDDFTKAGLVPFLRGEKYRFYVMKPVSRHASLSAAEFQLCKGTRMYLDSAGNWQDMRGGESAEIKETLAATALREGIEELGLKLANIGRLFDVGPYDFSSASSGKPKRMWMFAAEVIAAEDFLPSIEVAFTTAGREWLSLSEFSVAGRPDHHYILRDIQDKLEKA